MKGKKVYYLSGAAVLFVLGLFTLVLMSGPSAQNADDDALQNANPSSITRNSQWSEQLYTGDIEPGSEREARLKQVMESLPALDLKDKSAAEVNAAVKDRQRKIAEEMGELDIYLAKEEARQEKKAASTAKRERVQQESREHREWVVKRREAQRKIHEMVRAGQEPSADLLEIVNSKPPRAGK